MAKCKSSAVVETDTAVLATKRDGLVELVQTGIRRDLMCFCLAVQSFDHGLQFGIDVVFFDWRVHR